MKTNKKLVTTLVYKNIVKQFVYVTLLEIDYHAMTF